MPRRTVDGAKKKAPLNMRTTPQLRLKLEAACVASGRSLVQEVEHRIEQSFVSEKNHADQLQLEVEMRLKAEDEIEAAERRIEDLQIEIAELKQEKLDIAKAVQDGIAAAFRSAGLDNGNRS